MFEEKGFKLGHVFTAGCLGFLVALIRCRVTEFVCGLTWRAMTASTVLTMSLVMVLLETDNFPS